MATSSQYLSFSLAARFEDLLESTLPNVSWKFRSLSPCYRPALPLILYENPFHMIHPFWCTEH